MRQRKGRDTCERLEILNDSDVSLFSSEVYVFGKQPVVTIVTLSGMSTLLTHASGISEIPMTRAIAHNMILRNEAYNRISSSQ